MPLKTTVAKDHFQLVQQDNKHCHAKLCEHCAAIDIVCAILADGLWKEEHSRCQRDVEEQMADLCGENTQFQSDLH